ncbi:MAG: hypothetical protein Q9195_007156 [Heterodermia aff. obscurata]
MAPRTVRKARTKGSDTPLRRSRRGKQDEAAYQTGPESDEPKGKQSTDADLITSPQRVLREPKRSNNKEEAARAQQVPNIPEESVQADLNRGEDARTKSVSGAHEQVEQEDLAIDSVCDRPYGQAFCRWSCKLDVISTTFPICCSGRQPDVPYSSERVYSSETVPASKLSMPTILERLEGHKETCEIYQHTIFPSIKDDLETTTAYQIRLLDTYKKLCKSLDHIPGELMSYYLQVMGNATTIFRYARDAQNFTQDNMAYFSPPELKFETKGIQKYFSEAIPREGDMVASLKRVRGQLQWQFEKLNFDSHNLKKDLKDIRAQTLEAKSTALKPNSVQTDQEEPAEIQRYTKAIEGLDEWYAETNALELLLMHIDHDVESLQKLVNRLVDKRLSIRVGELFGKAELQEMQPLLTWIREDARRVHEVARRSKVMRGWKQRPESGRVVDSLRKGGSGGGERVAPWS